MESHASKAYYRHFNSPPVLPPPPPTSHVSWVSMAQAVKRTLDPSSIGLLSSRPPYPALSPSRETGRRRVRLEFLDGEEGKTSLPCPLLIIAIVVPSPPSPLHPPPPPPPPSSFVPVCTMAARRPHPAVLLVWITLLLLLLHGWNQLWRSSSGVAGTTADHGGLISGSAAGRATPRKMLSSKFDFSPFGVHHHRHHSGHRHRHRHGHHSPREVNREPSAGTDDEIDPRYGVEKRLVPTGPNPLHH